MENEKYNKFPETKRQVVGRQGARVQRAETIDRVKVIHPECWKSDRNLTDEGLRTAFA